MTPGFKSYLKNSYKEFLLSLIFPIVIYFIVNNKESIFFWIGFNILGFIPGYYKYKDQLTYNQKLKKKGLTAEDLDNIKFVKDWEDIRKKGSIKYSLIDGGIFFGFALSFIISIISLIVNRDLLTYLSDPTHMLNFIGYTYLAGAMLGIVIYRISWIYKEQKFIRLTDPLH